MEQYFCKPGAVIVQFKFADEASVIYAFRRVLIWGNTPRAWQESTAEMNARSLEWLNQLNTIPIVTHLWLYDADAFGSSAKHMRDSIGAGEYGIAELWLWSSEGWCLKKQEKLVAWGL